MGARCLSAWLVVLAASWSWHPAKAQGQATAFRRLSGSAGAGLQDDDIAHASARLRNRSKTIKSLLLPLAQGDTAGMESILRHGQELVRFRDQHATTILMKASNLSNPQWSERSVNLLLDAGGQATVSQIDRFGKTALMYAAERGNKKTASLLLSRPSSVSARDRAAVSKEVKALIDAIKRASLPQVTRLLSKAATTGMDELGQTALMMASGSTDKNFSLAATSLLLEKGGAKAVVNVVDYEGNSALARASKSHNFETCKLLVDHQGSLGPSSSLLPPKDLLRVQISDGLPKECKSGQFFCFNRSTYMKKFGELDLGSGETRFRAWAKGRSGWIRVFRSGECVGGSSSSCGRWDPATASAEKDWSDGDVILHQAPKYWSSGTRVRIKWESRYSHHSAACATLTANIYQDAGYFFVLFDDSKSYTYEYEDLEPCPEVMPFNLTSGSCSIDTDHCIMSPNFPNEHAGSAECSFEVKTSAVLHAVAGRDNITLLDSANTSAAAHLNLPMGYLAHAPRSLHWSSNHGGPWRVCEALIDWRDVYGETAVMKAIDAQSNEGLEVLELLLSKKANVEGSNKEGQTALMKACNYTRESSPLAQRAVKLLLDNGAPGTLQAADKSNKTALMYAVMKNQSELVQMLLNTSGMDTKDLINRTDQDNKSAFLYAAETCGVDMVRHLSDMGANMEQIDKERRNAFMFALKRGDMEVLRHLVDTFAPMEEERPAVSFDFHATFRNWTSPWVHMSFGKSNYLHMVMVGDINNKSAMGYACQYGHLEAVKLLEKHGASIRNVSETGKTALMYAVQSGNQPTVEYLLAKNRSDVLDATDRSGGRTALMFAAGKSKATTEMLIRRGANLKARDAEGRSVLMHAAAGGKADVIRLLLQEAGAPIYSGGQTGASVDSGLQPGAQPARVLTDACSSNTRGSMVNWQDKQGRTALFHATGGEGEGEELNETLKLLMCAGADVNLGNGWMFTPLMVAAEAGDLQSVRTLLEWSDDPKKTMDARCGGWWLNDIIGHLIVRSWGAWRSPLWLAAERGHLEVVEELTLRGADVLLRDRSRMLPVEIAQKGHHDKVAKFLMDNTPSFFAQVVRTYKFESTWRTLIYALLLAIVILLIFWWMRPRAEQLKPELKLEEPKVPSRGAWLLAARALRFRKSTVRRKLAYALNVCANVLMPFGPLMYFTSPDFVVPVWLVLYFFVPSLCIVCKCKEKVGILAAMRKIWESPSLAMTGKFLHFPWIVRWLRPRLLIWLVTFLELIVKMLGFDVPRPTSVLVFDRHASLGPIPVDMYKLYIGFLCAISVAAVCWRAHIIPVFGDLIMLCWVVFGTQAVGTQVRGAWAIGISLLLPAFPLALYIFHIYTVDEVDEKVWKEWWKPCKTYYSKDDDEHKIYAEQLTEHNDVKELALLIDEYEADTLRDDSRQRVGWKGPDADAFEKWCMTKKPKQTGDTGTVKLWQFVFFERILFSVLDNVVFDGLTIVLLLLADRFIHAFIMLLVVFSSLFVSIYLTYKEWSAGHSCVDEVTQTFRTGVPTEGFLRFSDRAHGFQDFFSLCITLRSMPLIAKLPAVMLIQMLSVSMSLWGLTTFLFEKLELEDHDLGEDYHKMERRERATGQSE